MGGSSIRVGNKHLLDRLAVIGPSDIVAKPILEELGMRIVAILLD